MPGLPDDSGDVPQSIVEAFELFCDLPEQSYEQFLSTFTHMSTDNVTTGCLEAPEEENKTCFVELKRDGVKTDRKVETEEESEGLRYIEALCALPGEVKEELTASTPAYCHHTQLDISSPDMEHRTHTLPRNTDNQSETEEVVPFSLDDTYDYDNVVLSHKYLVKSSNCGSS